MILLLDCFDSFSYNLWHYLQAGGAQCIVVREDEADIGRLSDMPLSGIVISPGPQSPQDHPFIFRLLEEMAGKVPILGICLGFQAIGQFAGMELIKAPVPFHGKVSQIFHNGHAMFHNITSPFSVTRYHSLCLKSEQNDMIEITARTKEGLPMSLSVRDHLIWGHQFHPESILTTDGQTLVENWLRAVPLNLGIL
ncbi:MAG: aminodeoxychorismate/anthranilate synthase component II [Bacteroidia bacterium]